MIRAVTAPARLAGSVVARAVQTMRRDAPGARMVGEFAVKTGFREAQRRFPGRRDTDQ